MALDPTVLGAIIAAIAGVVVAIVTLAPNFGKLRRLERIIAVLEKVDDPDLRAPIVAVRDALIRRLWPNPSERAPIVRSAQYRIAISFGLVGIGLTGLFVGLILTGNSAVSEWVPSAVTVGSLVVEIVGGGIGYRSASSGFSALKLRASKPSSSTPVTGPET